MNLFQVFIDEQIQCRVIEKQNCYFIRLEKLMRSYRQRINRNTTDSKISHGSFMDSPEKQMKTSNKPIRQYVQELQNKLNDEKNKREELEERYEMLKNKTVLKQQEFRHLLDANATTRQASTDKISRRLFMGILNNFGDLDEGNRNIMIKQMDHINKRMDNQIHEIMEQFKQQVQKTKIISSQTYTIIKEEVEKVLKTAKKLDQENFELREKISGLQTQNKVLAEQKNLLVQENLHKKKCIVKLYAEIKALKAKKQIPIAQINKFNSKNDPNDKNQTNQDFDNDCRFMCEPEISLKNEKMNITSSQKEIKRQEKKMDIFCSSYNFSNSGKMPRYGGSSASKYSSTKFQSDKKQKIVNISANYNINQRRSASKYAKGQQSEFTYNNHLLLLQGTSTHNQHQNVSPSKKISSKTAQMKQEAAISHLKKCLDRSKKKSSSLAKIVSKMQNRNTYANEAIGQALILFQKQIEGMLQQKITNEKQRQKIEQTKKLIQSLVALKKRLLALQQPVINCGWGDQLGKSIKLLQEESEELSQQLNQ